MQVIRLAIAALALSCLGAAPRAATYPLSDVEGEALVVPAGSPVTFKRFEEHIGHFDGRFALAGTLVYGCRIDCVPPLKPNDLMLFVIPDKAVAAKLPHWKLRADEIHVYFDNDDALANVTITAAERRALLSGKREEVRKRVDLNVTDFRLGIDCDSASYTARFVSLRRPALTANRHRPIADGCG